MRRIRVLIVEDSATVRAHLAEVLGRDPEIEVCGAAADGKEGIERCQALRPDVVTLDMILPVMSGLAATEYIMAHCPTPILVVSSSTNRGELHKTYEALAAGALDVLDKPRGDASDPAWERKLVDTVKLVSRIKVITHPRAKLAGLAQGRGGASPLDGLGAPPSPAGRPAIAIGASTGGPGAVVQVLRGIPTTLKLPIFLVLHIGEPFGAALADWLDGQTAHSVRAALHGEPVPTSGVIMAPPDRHLMVHGGHLRLSRDPERHSCRPSVDVLFESVARECGSAAAAAVLTGMGRDGAAGLLAIRQAGGSTIAQDEATSVVYGMPREAAAMGGAGLVLPLPEIGPALAAAVAAARTPA
jgi:two-component system chemotaxis response regulator CheB